MWRADFIPNIELVKEAANLPEPTARQKSKGWLVVGVNIAGISGVIAQYAPQLLALITNTH